MIFLEPPPDQAPCLACNNNYGPHPVGRCPLKAAGVERCNLCGLAHYGGGRTCPHLNSELKCRTMLKDLKDSPEPRELKQAAITYLRGVIGNLVRNKKLREEAANMARSRMVEHGVDQQGTGPQRLLLPLPTSHNYDQNNKRQMNGGSTASHIPLPTHNVPTPPFITQTGAGHGPGPSTHGLGANNAVRNYAPVPNMPAMTMPNGNR